MKLVLPDPERVSSTAPQEIPGFGSVPSSLDDLGMSEAEVRAAIKRGVPVILTTQKD